MCAYRVCMCVDGIDSVKICTHWSVNTWNSTIAMIFFVSSTRFVRAFVLCWYGVHCLLNKFQICFVCLSVCLSASRIQAPPHSIKWHITLMVCLTIWLAKCEQCTLYITIMLKMKIANPTTAAPTNYLRKNWCELAWSKKLNSFLWFCFVVLSLKIINESRPILRFTYI